MLEFRNELGLYKCFHEDDLLLCASMYYYGKLPCYLLPYDNKGRSAYKEELDDRYALSARSEHYSDRNNFIKRIICQGWIPLKYRGTVY